MKQKILLLLLIAISVICLTFGIAACSDSISSISTQKLSYTLSSNGKYYTVSGIGHCLNSEINIPDTYNDLPVTGIDSYAFNENEKITSVIIPNSITSIGSYAFNECTSLTNIVIGENVTSIGNYAFYNCTALIDISYNAINLNIESKSNYIFYHAGRSSTGINVTIGANVKQIPAVLFNPYNAIFNVSSGNCPKIKSVIFEEGSVCTSIGSEAFAYCTSLVNIDIPESITSIGNNAFNYCTALNNVYIKNIDSWCNISFSGSASNPLYYADNLYLYNFVNEEYELLTDLIISNTVQTIGDYTFYKCESLKNLIISDSVVSIGACAFYGCSSLETLVIGTNVTTFGNSAFWNCRELATIKYNATEVTSIETVSSNNYLFSYAGWNGNGVSVTIGANVKKIPSDLFNPNTSSNYSPNITSVIFEDGSACTSIGSRAFFCCEGLTEIIVPEKVTFIGKNAFYGCKLTSTTFLNTSGWYLSDFSPTATTGKSVTVSDPSTAATYLKSTYKDYYWLRS